MGRRKNFDEQAVINAAIAVFSEHGYTGTDVGLVCERANIGRSSFYNTFDSLDSLFLRALRDYTARGISAREELRTGTAPAPRLIMHRLGGELAKQCEDEARVGCLSANTAAELGREVDAVCAILDPDHQAWLESYRFVLERGQVEGHIRSELDAKVHAQLLSSVLAGLRIAARVMPADSVQSQATAFVEGLCTRKGLRALHDHTASHTYGRNSPGHLIATESSAQ
ncbi:MULTISPECIES: TetR/AcrR family transcriptional regulator [Brevibacterium]|uniref:Transcriptional regulator, TetR family n=2 Tax=Brevibacterium antiquum TaxID=234835 RepID=A0A2H1I7V6_9MICO|nr:MULTISPECIES: TetR/AcrR family transcriptional regulator [Brevibacterium]SMX71265.1 transcriptional regulator, TetR family [Brevibacterium antiquum CNRZ 918]SMX81374.1 transcriptional regulator, TetR family [Brevibacterium antiquum]HCG54597.1 TetR/AcrR family transcriptional regulator [Brevibacterium sp.]